MAAETLPPTDPQSPRPTGQADATSATPAVPATPEQPAVASNAESSQSPQPAETSKTAAEQPQGDQPATTEDASKQFEFEENAPERVAVPNQKVEIKHKELLDKITHGMQKQKLHKTFVPWVKVGLLGAVVQLFLGITWGLMLNAETGMLGPLKKYVNRVEDLQAVMYLVTLPVAYKILKRLAVDVPFVIATFSTVFLYGIYRLGRGMPATEKLEAYLTGLQPAELELAPDNPYIMLTVFLMLGVFIYLFATFATNTNKFKIPAFIALLGVAFAPYILEILI
jgi:hypothetical protein